MIIYNFIFSLPYDARLGK